MADVASTCSKAETAIALFGTKGLASLASSSTIKSATDVQAQQKRDASKRNHILNSIAPPHVVEKWEAINKLKSRDRQKNAEKTKFTEILLKDSKFEDGY